jgi:hypothetical protein
VEDDEFEAHAQDVELVQALLLQLKTSLDAWALTTSTLPIYILGGMDPEDVGKLLAQRIRAAMIDVGVVYYLYSELTGSSVGDMDQAKAAAAESLPQLRAQFRA